VACAARAAALGLDVALCADPAALRTAWAGKVHAHFGFPEGVSGRALLERALMQAETAGAELCEGAVQSVRARPEGTFDVRVRTGAASEPPLALVARAVVLADEPPDLPADAAVALAKAGIAPPAALASEEADLIGRRVVALVDGPRGAEAALDAARLTLGLAVVASGTAVAADATGTTPAGVEEGARKEDGLGEEVRARYAEAGVPLHEAAIVGAEATPEGGLAALLLDGGVRLECDGALVLAERRASVALGESLGVAVSDGGVTCDAAGRTALEGCWVVDGAAPWRPLAEAEAAGARVALGLWSAARKAKTGS
jgi:thioredoxin reductase (NADPH)